MAKRATADDNRIVCTSCPECGLPLDIVAPSRFLNDYWKKKAPESDLPATVDANGLLMEPCPNCREAVGVDVNFRFGQ